MPSIQCASGDGYVSKAFWKAKGTIIHANLEAVDRTLVTDNGEGGGTFPVRLRLHGYSDGNSTSVLLPTDAGDTNWAQQAAYEASLAVSTDADLAFSEHTFWLHVCLAGNGRFYLECTVGGPVVYMGRDKNGQTKRGARGRGSS